MAEELLRLASEPGITHTARQLIEMGKTMTAPAQPAHDPTDRPIQTCDVCTHPDAAHDAIARRYCAATMTNAIARKCICLPPAT